MEQPKSGFFPTVFSALLRPLIGYLDKSSLPTYEDELTLPGLRQRVEVQWDKYAIPTVCGANEHDLFLAQGYLHAQERLWQMELARRFLSGRMAEIFGAFNLPWRELSVQFRGHTSVEFDHFIRILGIRHAAVASLGQLAEPTQLHLRAYSDGVNHYIERCGKKLPWEFRLLRHQPEPWTAEDSLTINKGLAFLLSTALYTRLNMIAVADKLKAEPDKLRSLMPSYPADAPTMTHCTRDRLRELWQFTSGAASALDWHPAGHGSNSWAVAPSRSATGGALLSNDPHLRMTLPSTWYLMHLQTSGSVNGDGPYDVSGATIAGMPFVQIGRNRSIAWGVTAALCDDVEIYRERLHPLESDRYLFNQRWEKLDTRHERIAVRGKAAIDKIVRLTQHGPVISDYTTRRQDAEILSVKWTAHEASRELDALYGINRASDWQGFLEKLSLHTAPALNFVYADVTGNIGYSLAGKIPKRAKPPTLLPVAGWQEQNEWHGTIPFDELPRLFNPPGGVIASANNGIVDPAYPHYLSHFFEPPHRFARIQQLLNSREKHSLRDMTDMQMDDVSLHALELIATLKNELARLAGAQDILGRAAGQLVQWDGKCSIDSVTATIFHVFHSRLLANLLIPSLGEELFPACVEILNQCLTPTDRILGDAKSSWFAQRSRSALVALALREACAGLAEKLGQNLDDWQWGRLHQLNMNHAFSRIGALRPLISAGPFPAAGDGTTINMGFFRHSNPYGQTVGAALRMVIDLKNPGAGGFVLAAGQSGHPVSSHYVDQNERWRAAELINHRTEESEANVSRHLSLILD